MAKVDTIGIGDITITWTWECPKCGVENHENKGDRNKFDDYLMCKNCEAEFKVEYGL